MATEEYNSFVAYLDKIRYETEIRILKREVEALQAAIDEVVYDIELGRDDITFILESLRNLTTKE